MLLRFFTTQARNRPRLRDALTPAWRTTGAAVLAAGVGAVAARGLYRVLTDRWGTAHPRGKWNRINYRGAGHPAEGPRWQPAPARIALTPGSGLRCAWQPSSPGRGRCSAPTTTRTGPALHGFPRQWARWHAAASPQEPSNRGIGERPGSRCNLEPHRGGHAGRWGVDCGKRQPAQPVRPASGAGRQSGAPDRVLRARSPRGCFVAAALLGATCALLPEDLRERHAR